MKERPILFSAAMVRALLAGKKTQTRRIVKPPPRAISFAGSGLDGLWIARGKMEYRLTPRPCSNLADACPFGVAGDRLWVRETFAWHETAADGPRSFVDVRYAAHASVVRHEVDEAIMDRVNVAIENEESHGERNRPSIHMPRWASRISLEVVEVRVERLQDISEEDARAEGVSASVDTSTDGMTMGTARTAFAHLWHDINGSESWDANPWVWVVSFKLLEVRQ